MAQGAEIARTGGQAMRDIAQAGQAAGGMDALAGMLGGEEDRTP
jgi:hypothetical protein